MIDHLCQTALGYHLVDGIDTQEEYVVNGPYSFQERGLMHENS